MKVLKETLVSIWTRLRLLLEAAGVELPTQEARLLIEAGAGVSRLDIVTDPRRPLNEDQIARVEALAARRAAREPMAHILGRKGFWTLDLQVSAAVLVPRPETELLVEAAIEAIAPDAPARVLDLGVGSGAILLAILSERPNTVGVGVDASAPALAIARANGERIGLVDRTEFLQGDWWSGVEGTFDVVVSNPPYIPSADIEALAPEVALYEPRLALDGGDDGLAAYRSILAGMVRHLRPGGLFALEVGQGQADVVAALAESHGLEVAPPGLDLNGIARLVTGRVRGFCES